MGGIIENIKNKIINQAQKNLLYIVSLYFTQGKIHNYKTNPFVMCQPKEEKNDKKINNYPLISFKFDYSHIKFTKYEYRQMNVLQMIMLTPDIFVSLTDEGLQLWHNYFGIQKISAQFFDKLKSLNKSEIINRQLTKFDNDLFFLTFEMISNNNNIFNKNSNELNGLQFVLFSSKKIINEGKISELFSINRINTAFPINANQIFISIESEIKIIDIYQKKIVKKDKNLELFKFNITFAKHLFNDIILISSAIETKSMIYSTDKLNILYFISDKIEIAFTLGNNKVVLIGEKTKEILLLPDLYVLSLSQYETDIFNSIEFKSFYPINENSFLFINHKNKKLKEVVINENNELIITKDILCPTEFITFCPFIYTYENITQLLCSLFICRDQTYKITNYEFADMLEDEDCEQIYSSTKRLFLNFFEIDKSNNGEITSTNSTNRSSYKQLNDFENIYIPYSIISPTGPSTLNFAVYKNKKLYELNSFYNYFEPNMKNEIIYNNTKDIYILSIIKNMIIYIIKINEFESYDICHNYNFGDIKSKGIVNIGNNNVFIFYDKKAIIINILESFKSKINPIDTFLFPFNILYAYFYLSNIILISDTKIYLFDYNSKKIQKEMNLEFMIINDDDNIENIDINILQIQDEIYILIVGLNYLLFNINSFEKITNPSNYNLKQKYMLFFISFQECFEIIKKDIIINKVIETYKEKTDEQRHKIKYLSNNKLFVGTYPNKFFIFENNENIP